MRERARAGCDTADACLARFRNRRVEPSRCAAEMKIPQTAAVQPVEWPLVGLASVAGRDECRPQRSDTMKPAREFRAGTLDRDASQTLALMELEAFTSCCDYANLFCGRAMPNQPDSQAFRVGALLLAVGLLVAVAGLTHLTGARWPRKQVREYLARLASRIAGLTEIPCAACAVEYVRSMGSGFEFFSASPVCTRGRWNGHTIEIVMVPKDSKRPLRTMVAVLFERPTPPRIYVQENSNVMRVLNSIFVPGGDTTRALAGPYAVAGDPRDVQRILPAEKLDALLKFPRTLDFVRYEENAIALQWQKPAADASEVEHALALAVLLLPPAS